MQLVIAECQVNYTGRLQAHLPRARRLLMRKADGSVLVHSDGGSYKPLNWMSPPCRWQEEVPTPEQVELGVQTVWRVLAAKGPDQLVIEIFELISELQVELGADPGLVKDGVEAHLQELLAQQVDLLGPGLQLVRREFPTAVGPVDVMVRDRAGGHVAVEIKRRGDIDGVEQLTRYLELLNRDPRLAPVKGVFAAQEIRPQARVLAQDRGITCLVLDYEAMRGVDDPESRLF